MKSIKISDVAKAAGVSLATVSRVISNRGGVRPETREQVMRIIKELDYQPNALARQMRTQKTKTVIVIVPNIANSLFHSVIHGIESEAEQSGYQVLIADMHDQSSVEMYYMNAIRQRQVDGIISMSANMTQKLIQEVSSEYPIVMAIQSFQSDTIPSVAIDNFTAAKAITTHLIRMGHHKIAHITSVRPLSLYQDRLNGYTAALEEHGIPVNPLLIRYGNPTFQGGYEQMQNLLSSKDEITALFAAGDTMAIGAMKALKQAGIKVPQMCAVTGFDDIELASFWDPPLTTIRQPAFQIGQNAFRKLLALMGRETVINLRDILSYELVIRESCGYFGMDI